MVLHFASKRRLERIALGGLHRSVATGQWANSLHRTKAAAKALLSFITGLHMPLQARGAMMGLAPCGWRSPSLAALRQHSHCAAPCSSAQPSPQRRTPSSGEIANWLPTAQSAESMHSGRLK